jgi:hypothetical protein
MNTRSTMVALALCAFGLLGVSSLSASAAIVCNNAGDCWHTPKTYVYPPSARIVIHPNNWRWGPSEHFAWKEHEGPGYWRGGTWVNP